MARKLVLFLVVMVAVLECTNGMCNLSMFDMMKCLPAVTNTNPTLPKESDPCCTAVKRLSSSDFQCLCDYKNTHTAELQQQGVDAGRAARLPVDCKAPNAIACP